MKKFKEVLLVDDDPVTNFINEKVLRKLHLTDEIRIATNGQEALGIIKGNCDEDLDCPELILLDINMPVMNGFEFLEQYRCLPVKNREKVHIIILSSSSNPTDLKMAALNNIPILSKPLTGEVLGKILES